MAEPGVDIEVSVDDIPPEFIDQAWHAWRGKGIGGSDIATILGLSNYASPVSLYYEKCGALPDREPDTQRQRLGKAMEAVLADEFHIVTGLYCVGAQTWCEMAGNDWARCTVDGLVSDHELPRIGVGEHVSEIGLLGTVQFKTDGRFGWPQGVPPNIRAQCVWEMGVTGLHHCWLVVMFAGFRVEVFEIDWDFDAQADWEFMFDQARDFWEQHVLAGVVPDIDDHPATQSVLADVYRTLDDDAYLEADIAARNLVAELAATKQNIKAHEALEARISNELRALLGGATELVAGVEDTKQGPRRRVIASWREQGKTNFRTKDFRAAHPALAAEFTTSSTTRVLRVHTKGEQA